MKQYGFLSGITLYAVIAAVAVVGGLGIALKIQSSRLAAAQEQLSACKETNKLLNGQIQRQNEAIKVLAQEAENRVRRAQAASEVARQGVVKAQNEIGRLRASKGTVTDCPARDAVRDVRQGLK